ncbi:hypothetical protein [Stutzerimonas stutzeri]|uniref:hypothetical protein n=1 Tax=Stutzerimonas stutzeri TaxID=316 RepID=UPI000397AFB5|nr:hypothetical protein [Stutzerimonas stutzeri]EQM78099.1 hypothetical protein L686_13360 [Stutzerimonas stutzeri MF28]
MLASAVNLAEAILRDQLAHRLAELRVVPRQLGHKTIFDLPRHLRIQREWQIGLALTVLLFGLLGCPDRGIFGGLPDRRVDGALHGVAAHGITVKLDEINALGAAGGRQREQQGQHQRTQHGQALRFEAERSAWQQ